MRKKPYTAIESAEPDFIAEVVRVGGRPDNFVESAEATMVGLPDPETDESAKRLLAALDSAVRDLQADAAAEHQNGTNGGSNGTNGHA